MRKRWPIILAAALAGCSYDGEYPRADRYEPVYQEGTYSSDRYDNGEPDNDDRPAVTDIGPVYVDPDDRYATYNRSVDRYEVSSPATDFYYQNNYYYSRDPYFYGHGGGYGGTYRPYFGHDRDDHRDRVPSTPREERNTDERVRDREQQRKLRDAAEAQDDRRRDRVDADREKSADRANAVRAEQDTRVRDREVGKEVVEQQRARDERARVNSQREQQRAADKSAQPAPRNRDRSADRAAPKSEPAPKTEAAPKPKAEKPAAPKAAPKADPPRQDRTNRAESPSRSQRPGASAGSEDSGSRTRRR